MSQPRVLVSVLNWNGGDETLQCLRSIYQSTYRPFTVLVIDNASVDGSLLRIKEEFPDAAIVKNHENRGFAGAQNQGIRYADEHGYELVWILNNDTQFATNVLSELVSAIESDSAIGMVSPVICDNDASGRIQFSGCAIRTSSFSFQSFSSAEEANAAQQAEPDAFCLWGTALLARTALVSRLGGFDSGYFAYYEDLDLSVRVSRSGYRNRIVSTAVVRHGGVNDPATRPPHYVYFNTRNRCRFWKKHLRGMARLRFLREFLAGSLIYASTWQERASPEKVNAAALGIWDGLTGRQGGWEPSRYPPRLPFRLLLAKPYFIADVLRGNLVERLFRNWRQGS